MRQIASESKRGELNSRHYMLIKCTNARTSLSVCSAAKCSGVRPSPAGPMSRSSIHGGVRAVWLAAEEDDDEEDEDDEDEDAAAASAASWSEPSKAHSDSALVAASEAV